MSEELKPCPFCGGEAKTRRFYGDAHTTAGCTKCGAKIVGKDGTKKAAIKAWNKREEKKGND